MRYVFLSPHLDDAALSCGGTIAALVAGGDEVLVVNVCTGLDLAAAPSALAADLHARWGLEASVVMSARRAEDQEALAILGASSIALDLLDAIYRRPDRYGSLDALFSEVAEDDPFDQQIQARLDPILSVPSIVYAPLGVGGHVDHRSAHGVGRSLLTRGLEVLFYEDLPYATRAGVLEARLTELGSPFGPEPIEIDRTIGQKTAAIACYRSQLASLFGGADAMTKQITDHAKAAGEALGLGGVLVERRWRLGSEPPMLHR